MPSNYPDALDTDETLPDKTAHTDKATVADFNLNRDCIRQIEAELGTNPSMNKDTLKQLLQTFLTADGLLNAESVRLRMPCGTSFPESPAEGDLFTRTDEHKAYWYNGTEWIEMCAGGLEDLTLGDILVASNDPQVSNNASLMYKKKEFQLKVGGSIRIKHGLRATSPRTAYSQIYRNGSGVGTYHSTSSVSYVTFNDDIAGWSAGDLCQLYIKTSVYNYPAYAANFRLYAASNPVADVTL